MEFNTDIQIWLTSYCIVCNMLDCYTDVIIISDVHRDRACRHADTQWLRVNQNDDSIISHSREFVYESLRVA
jgi:hypothetical protein